MDDVKCSTCRGEKVLEFEQGQRRVPCVTCSGSGVDWRKSYDAQRLRADTAEAELAKFEGEIAASLPGVRLMDLPDGGSPTLGEQVGRMAEALAAAEQRIEAMVKVLTDIRQSCELSHLRDAQIDAALNPKPEAGSHE